MEGYVYIARIIDHGGKFVNGYHKIGLSKQYKVRETQLNSTHLPFDVLMVRVFETENMKKLEGLLHLCFEDYRVVKEYDYRKNITTEWFDVSDIDVFNDRLDKFIELLDVNELDMGTSIDSDSTMTNEEKEETKEIVGRAKANKIRLTIGTEVYQDDTQKNLMYKAYSYLVNKVGHEKIAKMDRFVSLDINNFRKTLDSHQPETPVTESNIIFDLGGSYLWTATGAQAKKKHIDKICNKFGIEELKFEII
jgi:hypothetical protein